MKGANQALYPTPTRATLPAGSLRLLAGRFCIKIKSPLLLAFVAACCLLLTDASAETAAEALARFDRVSAKTENPLHKDLFTGIGREIAYRHQTRLIPLILQKSDQWKGEEGLLYLPIVLNLPLEDAMVAFTGYTKGSDEKKALWAREFLIEIEAYLSENLKKVGQSLERK